MAGSKICTPRTKPHYVIQPHCRQVGENFDGDHKPTVARDGGPEMAAHAKELVDRSGYQCIRLVYDGRGDSGGIFEPR